MKYSARYSLLLCLNLFYIVSLSVYNVLYVASTLLNTQVYTSWEGARNLSKCLFWIVDDFVSYGLFECI